VRASLAGVPAYVPGRPPQAANATTYKLASNETPQEPLPSVRAAISAEAGRANRYPDMGCTELYAALAARWQVAPEQLVVGAGSVAVLYHLVQALCEPGDEIVHACRSAPVRATTWTPWPTPSPTAPGSCSSARPTTRRARR
jgi:histidinol-phosphate aminotransferase